MSATYSLPGLPGTVLALVDAELARLGRPRTGVPEVVRAWSISTVLRIPTGRGPVWFKSVPPAFAHEGRVTRWAAAAVPEHGVQVIGSGANWLLTEEIPDGGTPTGGHPLRAAARIQLASVGRTGELTAIGCPTRGAVELTRDLRTVAGRPDLLAPQERRALADALPRLAALLTAAEESGVPSVLVHGDLQPENARWTGRTWVIIDWTDAAVAHPFTELARPLLEATEEERRAAESAFTEVWSTVLPARAVRDALRDAPALGAAHQVGNYLRIVDGIGGADGLLESLQGWARRLIEAVPASLRDQVTANPPTKKEKPDGRLPPRRDRSVVLPAGRDAAESPTASGVRPTL